MGRWSRLVAAELLARLDPPPGLRWLDVGCGTGVLTRAVQADRRARARARRRPVGALRTVSRPERERRRRPRRAAPRRHRVGRRRRLRPGPQLRPRPAGRGRRAAPRAAPRRDRRRVRLGLRRRDAAAQRLLARGQGRRPACGRDRRGPALRGVRPATAAGAARGGRLPGRAARRDRRTAGLSRTGTTCGPRSCAAADRPRRTSPRSTTGGERPCGRPSSRPCPPTPTAPSGSPPGRGRSAGLSDPGDTVEPCSPRHGLPPARVIHDTPGRRHRHAA